MFPLVLSTSLDGWVGELVGGWVCGWVDGWVALEEWKLRLTQPPAGVSLAGAGAELGKNYFVKNNKIKNKFDSKRFLGPRNLSLNFG